MLTRNIHAIKSMSDRVDELTLSCTSSDDPGPNSFPSHPHSMAAQWRWNRLAGKRNDIDQTTRADVESPIYRPIIAKYCVAVLFFAVVWKCSTPCERRRARSLQFLANRACADLPWAACDAAPHSCLNCCTGWGQHLAKSFMQHKPQGDRKSRKTGNTWFTNLHYLHVKSRNCTHAQRLLQHPFFSKVDEFPVQTSQCGCCPGRAIWRSCRYIISICFPGFMYPSFRLFWDETQICHITFSMSLFLEDLVPRRRPVWMCGVWCPWLRTSKWDHILSARLSCKRVVPNFNSRTSEFSQPRVSITNTLDHRCATTIF